ncbi:unnamed protein product [Rotaria magnacalcarata]
MSAIFTESTRGKRQLCYLGYRFSLKRKNQNGSEYWICVKCQTTATSYLHLSVFVREDHTHLPDETDKELRTSSFLPLLQMCKQSRRVPNSERKTSTIDEIIGKLKDSLDCHSQDAQTKIAEEVQKHSLTKNNLIEAQEKLSVLQHTIEFQCEQMNVQQQTITKLGDQIGSQQQTIGEQGEQIRSQQQTIAEQGEQIRSQQQTIAEQGEQIRSQQQTIAEQGEQIRSQQQTIGEQGEQMRSQQQTIVEQGEQIRSQQQTIAEQGEQIRSQQQTIGEQEKRLNLQNDKLEYICQKLTDFEKTKKFTDYANYWKALVVVVISVVMMTVIHRYLKL